MNHIARTSRPATALAALLTLFLSAGVATAGPKAAVSRAIGGKTMSGYRPVSGSAVKLRKPATLRKASATPPTDAASVSIRGRGGAAVTYLDGPHYKDVRDASLALLRAYRPEKHFYVALGRSPVAIASFLAELNPNMVMTFPASDLRLGVEAGWKQQFFDHFEQLIPDDVLAGKRTVVLFDRSHDRSGTSLSAMQGLLAEYLRVKNGKKVPVKAVGLAAAGPLVGDVEHLSTARFPGTFRYFSGRDDDEEFAPFLDKHRIGVEPIEQINENPQHWTMRKAMKERMAHDAELDQVLAREFDDLVEDAADD